MEWIQLLGIQKCMTKHNEFNFVNFWKIQFDKKMLLSLVLFSFHVFLLLFLQKLQLTTSK